MSKTVDVNFVRQVLPAVSDDANKYSAGSLMCFAGGYGMVGAAVLCAKAAYRSGAGIVNIVTDERVWGLCASSLLEAVYTPVSTYSSAFDAVEHKLDKYNAVVFGPGLGQGDDIYLVLKRLITENTKPLIIDADGINVLSKHIDILKEKSCEILLTPHEGEMSRLCSVKSDYIRNNRQKVCESFAKEYGISVLLKGRNTIIADSTRLMVNPTGNSGLATAGSGDVLSGIIGAFACAGVPLFESGAVGAYLHGLSGDKASDALGKRSVTASDVIEYLPECFKEC